MKEETRDKTEGRRDHSSLTRREIVALAGSAGAALVIGCGGGGVSKSSSTTTTSSTSGGTGSESCTVTPEGEIGPYFADDSASGFLRSNILANLDGSDVQTGIPFALTVYVYDAENSCAALTGAQVDIWHCNASGVYSDISSENSSADTYLRGYQITDSAGKVTFTTIVPGWYEGRTTHIHLRIRSKYSEASSTSDGTNTTQLFFPQTIVDYINSNVSPYSANGTDSTTNAGDRVYTTETHAEMLMTVTGSDTAGYPSTVSIYLPITAESS